MTKSDDEILLGIEKGLGVSRQDLPAEVRRLYGLSHHARELEEKLCHAELARDNALVMRDQAMASKKAHGESASRRIGALIALARKWAQLLAEADGRHTNEVMQQFEAELKEILK